MALPRVVPNTRLMRWFEVTSLDCLEVGAYGIEEPPLEGCVELDAAGETGDVALVPGLAFDLAGHRMGYGGGFYDTFLSGFRGHSLGLARSVERVGELAFLEPHDRAVEMVVSDVGDVRLWAEPCSRCEDGALEPLFRLGERAGGVLAVGGGPADHDDFDAPVGSELARLAYELLQFVADAGLVGHASVAIEVPHDHVTCDWAPRLPTTTAGNPYGSRASPRGKGH